MFKKLLLGLLLITAGCQTQNQITVDKLPEWIDTGKILAHVEVQTQVAMRYPNAIVTVNAGELTTVSYKWLEEYLDWTWKVSKIAGIKYTPESFNCVDFSLLFTGFADLAASQAGVKAAPMMARVSVQVSPVARHELIGVATDKGIFIVEPQPEAGPFRITPIEKYTLPILTITFKDYNAP